MARLYKRGNKWGVDYIDPIGVRIRKAVSPYKETAKKVLQKIEIGMMEGKYLDIKKNGDVLFEDFAEQYFDTHVKLENKNFKNRKNKLNILVRYFKGKHLYQINNFAVRQYMAQRIKNVKPSSVNRDVALLRSMFNRAIEWEVFVSSNPVKGIKKLPENNERCRCLTEKEQVNLLSHCENTTKVIVLIALKTGMHWGEIANLKWHQIQNSNYIDFTNNVFFVHESLSKSKKSRYIPVAESINTVLKKFPKQQGSSYIFLNQKTDKPLGSIKKSFKKALQKAGIKDFKFHDLRHTFASQLVMNGTDLYIVQKLLGHSTMAMTERYAHLRPEQFKSAIDKLEKNDGFLNNIGYNNFFENGTDLAHSNN